MGVQKRRGSGRVLGKLADASLWKSLTHRQRKSHVEVENAHGDNIQQDAVNI